MSRSGLTKLCVLPAGLNRVIPFRWDSRVNRGAATRVQETSSGKTIVWEGDHDFGNRRQWKRRENSFAGSGEKRSEASRDVPVGGGSGESPGGNGDGDCGLCETGNVECCVEGCGERVFGVFADSGAG